MSVLFPRLGAQLLQRHLQEVMNRSVEQLLKEYSEPRLEIGEVYGETGGARIRRGELLGLQKELRLIARQHGFPSASKGEKVMQFDQRAAVHLFEKMRITAHEASQPGVWQYLCCMAVPDIVRWRFPGKETQGSKAERFLGGRRNLLGRLWWRAYVLGDDDARPEERHNLMRSLGEDELVQLMERSSVFGDRRLVRASASAFLLEAAKGKVSRQSLMRDLQRRLIRQMPVFHMSSMGDAELFQALSTLARLSASSISKHGFA